MYNLTNSQKAAQMLKTTLGMVLLALGIVGVHFIAWVLYTYAPILTLILLAWLFTYLIIQVYLGLRDSK